MSAITFLVFTPFGAVAGGRRPPPSADAARRRGTTGVRGPSPGNATCTGCRCGDLSVALARNPLHGRVRAEPPLVGHAAGMLPVLNISATSRLLRGI